MANLQIKGIEDDLYAQLGKVAAAENRSISQQVMFLIKKETLRGANPSNVFRLPLKPS